MSRRILIVEDDDDVREELAQLLLQEGFEVDAAGDGQRALETMREQLPDVVLLDLSMPNMNGSEFRDAMLKNEMLTRVPVIVMTAAHPSVRPIIAATEFVDKPFVIEDLLAAIRRLCGARQAPGRLV